MLNQLGTIITTKLFGIKVGIDEYGNTYYNSKNSDRRWVMYFKNNDASSVPAEWQSWLTKTTNILPKVEDSKYAWQLEHKANDTGSTSLINNKTIKNNQKNAAYSAWTPQNKKGEKINEK